MTAPASGTARQLTRMQIAILLTNWYGPAIVRAFLPTHELRRRAWTVHQQIADRETPSVARAWMIGRNPQLDDQEPIRAIAAGRIRDVEQAAANYSNGVRT